MKERVAYRALYNRFKTMADKAKKENRQEAGRDDESMATAMYGMMDAYMRTFYKDQQDEEYISRYLYSSEYAIRLDSLSAQHWQITIASSHLLIRMPSSNTSASHSIAMPISSRI